MASRSSSSSSGSSGSSSDGGFFSEFVTLRPTPGTSPKTTPSTHGHLKNSSTNAATLPAAAAETKASSPASTGPSPSSHSPSHHHQHGHQHSHSESSTSGPTTAAAAAPASSSASQPSAAAVGRPVPAPLIVPDTTPVVLMGGSLDDPAVLQHALSTPLFSSPTSSPKGSSTAPTIHPTPAPQPAEGKGNELHQKATTSEPQVPPPPSNDEPSEHRVAAPSSHDTKEPNAAAAMSALSNSDAVNGAAVTDTTGEHSDSNQNEASPTSAMSATTAEAATALADVTPTTLTAEEHHPNSGETGQSQQQQDGQEDVHQREEEKDEAAVDADVEAAMNSTPATAIADSDVITRRRRVSSTSLASRSSSMSSSRDEDGGMGSGFVTTTCDATTTEQRSVTATSFVRSLTAVNDLAGDDVSPAQSPPFDHAGKALSVSSSSGRAGGGGGLHAVPNPQQEQPHSHHHHHHHRPHSVGSDMSQGVSAHHQHSHSAHYRPASTHSASGLAGDSDAAPTSTSTATTTTPAAGTATTSPTAIVTVPISGASPVAITSDTLANQQMDDGVYLAKYRIPDVIAELALALLEQKPEDHVGFAQNWVVDRMVREEERLKQLSHTHTKRHAKYPSSGNMRRVLTANAMDDDGADPVASFTGYMDDPTSVVGTSHTATATGGGGGAAGAQRRPGSRASSAHRTRVPMRKVVSYGNMSAASPSTLSESAVAYQYQLPASFSPTATASASPSASVTASVVGGGGGSGPGTSPCNATTATGMGGGTVGGGGSASTPNAASTGGAGMAGGAGMIETPPLAVVGGGGGAAAAAGYHSAVPVSSPHSVLPPALEAIRQSTIRPTKPSAPGTTSAAESRTNTPTGRGPTGGFPGLGGDGAGNTIAAYSQVGSGVDDRAGGIGSVPPRSRGGGGVGSGLPPSTMHGPPLAPSTSASTLDGYGGAGAGGGGGAKGSAVSGIGFGAGAAVGTGTVSSAMTAAGATGGSSSGTVGVLTYGTAAASGAGMPVPTGIVTTAMTSAAPPNTVTAPITAVPWYDVRRSTHTQSVPPDGTASPSTSSPSANTGGGGGTPFEGFGPMTPPGPMLPSRVASNPAISNRGSDHSEDEDHSRGGGGDDDGHGGAELAAFTPLISVDAETKEVIDRRSATGGVGGGAGRPGSLAGRRASTLPGFQGQTATTLGSSTTGRTAYGTGGVAASNSTRLANAAAGGGVGVNAMSMSGGALMGGAASVLSISALGGSPVSGRPPHGFPASATAGGAGTGGAGTSAATSAAAGGGIGNVYASPSTTAPPSRNGSFASGATPQRLALHSFTDNKRGTGVGLAGGGVAGNTVGGGGGGGPATNTSTVDMWERVRGLGAAAASSPPSLAGGIAASGAIGGRLSAGETQDHTAQQKLKQQQQQQIAEQGHPPLQPSSSPSQLRGAPADPGTASFTTTATTTSVSEDALKADVTTRTANSESLVPLISGPGTAASATDGVHSTAGSVGVAGTQTNTPTAMADALERGSSSGASNELPMPTFPSMSSTVSSSKPTQSTTPFPPSATASGMAKGYGAPLMVSPGTTPSASTVDAVAHEVGGVEEVPPLGAAHAATTTTAITTTATTSSASPTPPAGPTTVTGAATTASAAPLSAAAANALKAAAEAACLTPGPLGSSTIGGSTHGPMASPADSQAVVVRRSPSPRLTNTVNSSAAPTPVSAPPFSTTSPTAAAATTTTATTTTVNHIVAGTVAVPASAVSAPASTHAPSSGLASRVNSPPSFAIQAAKRLHDMVRQLPANKYATAMVFLEGLMAKPNLTIDDEDDEVEPPLASALPPTKETNLALSGASPLLYGAVDHHTRLGVNDLEDDKDLMQAWGAPGHLHGHSPDGTPTWTLDFPAAPCPSPIPSSTVEAIMKDALSQSILQKLPPTHMSDHEEASANPAAPSRVGSCPALANATSTATTTAASPSGGAFRMQMSATARWANDSAAAGVPSAVPTGMNSPVSRGESPSHYRPASRDRSEPGAMAAVSSAPSSVAGVPATAAGGGGVAGSAGKTEDTTPAAAESATAGVATAGATASGAPYRATGTAPPTNTTATKSATGGRGGGDAGAGGGSTPAAVTAATGAGSAPSVPASTSGRSASKQPSPHHHHQQQQLLPSPHRSGSANTPTTDSSRRGGFPRQRASSGYDDSSSDNDFLIAWRRDQPGGTAPGIRLHAPPPTEVSSSSTNTTLNTSPATPALPEPLTERNRALAAPPAASTTTNTTSTPANGATPSGKANAGAAAVSTTATASPVSRGAPAKPMDGDEPSFPSVKVAGGSTTPAGTAAATAIAAKTANTQGHSDTVSRTTPSPGATPAKGATSNPNTAKATPTTTARETEAKGSAATGQSPKMGGSRTAGEARLAGLSRRHSTDSSLASLSEPSASSKPSVDAPHGGTYPGRAASTTMLPRHSFAPLRHSTSLSASSRPEDSPLGGPATAPSPSLHVMTTQRRSDRHARLYPTSPTEGSLSEATTTTTTTSSRAHPLPMSRDGGYLRRGRRHRSSQPSHDGSSMYDASSTTSGGIVPGAAVDVEAGRKKEAAAVRRRHLSPTPSSDPVSCTPVPSSRHGAYTATATQTPSSTANSSYRGTTTKTASGAETPAEAEANTDGTTPASSPSDTKKKQKKKKNASTEDAALSSTLPAVQPLSEVATPTSALLPPASNKKKDSSGSPGSRRRRHRQSREGGDKSRFSSARQSHTEQSTAPTSVVTETSITFLDHSTATHHTAHHGHSSSNRRTSSSGLPRHHARSSPHHSHLQSLPLYTAVRASVTSDFEANASRNAAEASAMQHSRASLQAAVAMTAAAAAEGSLTGQAPQGLEEQQEALDNSLDLANAQRTASLVVLGGDEVLRLAENAPPSVLSTGLLTNPEGSPSPTLGMNGMGGGGGGGGEALARGSTSALSPSAFAHALHSGNSTPSPDHTPVSPALDTPGASTTNVAGNGTDKPIRSVVAAFSTFLAQEHYISQEELNDVREAVASYEPLSDLEQTQLETLVRAMTRQVLTKGEVLVKEDDPSLKQLLLVVDGEVDVLRQGQVSRLLTKGSFYGEMEISYNVDKSRFTLVTMSDTAVVYALAKRDYEDLVVHEKDARQIMFLQYINQVPLFQSMSQQTKMAFADSLRVCRVKKNAVLTRQGELVEWLYIIMAGTVTMTAEVSASSLVHRSSFLAGGDESLRVPDVNGLLAMDSRRVSSTAAARSTGLVTVTTTTTTNTSNSVTVVDDEDGEAPPPNKSAGHTVAASATATSHVAESTATVEVAETGAGTGAAVASPPDATGVTPPAVTTVVTTVVPPSLGAEACSSVAPTIAGDTGNHSQHAQITPSLNMSALVLQSQNSLLTISTTATTTTPASPHSPTPAVSHVEVTRGPGELVGESEFVFKCRGLLTAVATTPVHAARLNRLVFEVIMTRQAVEEMKAFMMLTPSYHFFESTAPEEVKKEMRQLLLRRRVGHTRHRGHHRRRADKRRMSYRSGLDSIVVDTARDSITNPPATPVGSPASMVAPSGSSTTMTGTSHSHGYGAAGSGGQLLTIKTHVVEPENSATVLSLSAGSPLGVRSPNSRPSHSATNPTSALLPDRGSYVQQHGQPTSSVEKALNRDADSSPLTRSPPGHGSLQPHHSHKHSGGSPGSPRLMVANEFNATADAGGTGQLTRQSTTHQRVASTRRSSAGNRWRQVSAAGELVFSGSRNLYRFPAQALRTNNSIWIAVIADGTIIRWNAVAQRVTGFAPFEVIGQNVLDLISTDESRQRMREMLQVGKQYAGNWDEYTKGSLERQFVFPFRQNTGLYTVGVALSVIPSSFSTSAEVLLLLGREAKYRAASTYAADVAKWLDDSLKPQLRYFTQRFKRIEANNWVVTQDDVIRLRGHIEACTSLVDQFQRFSLLNMETVNESWRPLRLPAVIRRFSLEATSRAQEVHGNFYCNTDAITPRTEVFLDIHQVLEVLRRLIIDALQFPAADGGAINVELRVSVVEPDETSNRFVPVFPGGGGGGGEGVQRAGAANPPSLAGAGSPTANARFTSPRSATVPGPAGTEPTVVEIPFTGLTSAAKAGGPLSGSHVLGTLTGISSSITGSGLRRGGGGGPGGGNITTGTGNGNEHPSSAHPDNDSECTSVDRNEFAATSSVAASSRQAAVDLSPNSMRRIRFEMIDNGVTIPSLRPAEAASDLSGDDLTAPGRMAKSKAGTPTTNGPMLNSDGTAMPFPSGNMASASANNTTADASDQPPRPSSTTNSFNTSGRPRGMELRHVETAVDAMGGIVYGFTRPQVDGNVVCVELPLLPVPGSTEEEQPDEEETVQGPMGGGRTFTVIVADNNRMQQNHLCQILWARQHAVVPVSSFKELLRKVEANTADILIIDPLQIDITQEDYSALQGSDPFDDIRDATGRMVLVVVANDFSDWRVQRLLDRNAVIELPKLGSGALVHIAMQEAERMATEMRDDEERIELIRRTFTNTSEDRYKVIRTLGKGAFGDVFEVEDTLTGGKMAMKRMLLHDGLFADEVLEEIQAMTSLQHENIIHYFHGEKESDAVVRLYMELAPNGTLKTKIRQTPGVGLPFDQIVQHLTDICRGLAYVHSQHYVHGDLKTANLLIGTRGRTKIGDFGTAKKLKPHQQLYTCAGTSLYMAPEKLTADIKEHVGYGFKADIWSVGCIVLEMATGQQPFAHLERTHGMGIYKYLADLTDTPDISPLFAGNPLIYEFVKACLDIDPDNRPTAQELLHFDILQGAVTSDRAERIVKRAEMLYKLNMYAAMRGEQSNETDGSRFSETDSNATDDYQSMVDSGDADSDDTTSDDSGADHGVGSSSDSDRRRRRHYKPESDFFSSSSSGGSSGKHGGDEGGGGGGPSRARGHSVCSDDTEFNSDLENYVADLCSTMTTISDSESSSSQSSTSSSSSREVSRRPRKADRSPQAQRTSTTTTTTTAANGASSPQLPAEGRGGEPLSNSHNGRGSADGSAQPLSSSTPTTIQRQKEPQQPQASSSLLTPSFPHRAYPPLSSSSSAGIPHPSYSLLQPDTPSFPRHPELLTTAVAGLSPGDSPTTQQSTVAPEGSACPSTRSAPAGSTPTTAKAATTSGGEEDGSTATPAQSPPPESGDQKP